MVRMTWEKEGVISADRRLDRTRPPDPDAGDPPDPPTPDDDDAADPPPADAGDLPDPEPPPTDAADAVAPPGLLVLLTPSSETCTWL